MKNQDISENRAKIVFLAIGSNLGNRKNNIEKTKFFLHQNKIKFISVSKYYETPSWPYSKYPKYLNIILKVECALGPLDLLKICKQIEINLGRKNSFKNSPRLCDIDIIDYSGMNIRIKNKLHLPHQRLHKRNFVLIPLFDIEKNWVHPTNCLLYTSPSPRDATLSRMPSSA